MRWLDVPAKRLCCATRRRLTRALDIWGLLEQAGITRSNVGACVSRGPRVGRDVVEAPYCWGRGAERGDTHGQAILGVAFHPGAAVNLLTAQLLQLVRRALSPVLIAGCDRLSAKLLSEPAP
jgi:hypothetical protein